MNCFRCQRPLPVGAIYCPWCGNEQRLRDNLPEGGRLEDFECPLCGRGRLLSEEAAESTPLPPDLDFQRLRFVAARRARERERSLDEREERRSARSRERIFALTQEVGAESYLVLADGRVIKHVAELASCLDEIPPEVFRSHVNDLRNDLAEWVERVFEDPALAGQMRNVEEPRRLQLQIYRYLAGRDPDDPDEP